MRCHSCKKIITDEKMKIYYNGTHKVFCGKDCCIAFLNTEKQKTDRSCLYKTICRVFSLPTISKKLIMEAERLKNDGITYKNLAAVLHYMYEVKKMWIGSPTLYYVKDNLEEARLYYQNISEKEKQVERVKQMLENQPKQVNIIKPNYNKRKSGIKVNPSEV